MTSWRLPALILGGLAALVAVTFPETLTVGANRVPGLDASIHYGWEIVTRSALADGMLPFWDPYVFAGMPHLADTQSNVLYPPALLLRWLPPTLFLAWMALLHVWLMGAGALLLARVAGMGWPSAATVAVAVSLGGSTAARLYNGHLVVLNSVAWLPLAMALSLLSVRRPRLLPHAGLVLVLVCQFLAGYAQGTMYLAAAVVGWFLYAAVWPELGSAARSVANRGQVLVQLGLLAVLALGLGAFQLVPLADLLGQASRADGIPYEEAVANGWTFRDLAGVFWPFVGVEAEPAVRFVADRAMYVGWVLACAVPFAFLDRKSRRLAVFFLLLAAVAVAMALGDSLPFYRLHHALFPGLREPGRFLFLATVALAVVGGLGLEPLVGLASRREWRRLVTPAAVTLAALVAATVVALSQQAGVVPVHGWPWLPVAMAIAVASLVTLGARGGVQAALVLAFCASAADVATYSRNADNTSPAGAADEIRRWLGPPDSGRVLSVCENRLAAGGVLLAGRGSLSGLGGLRLRDYAEWLQMLGVAERPSDRIGEHGVRRDMVDAANVTTVVACEPLDAPGLTLVSEVDGVRAYRNEAAWPRAVWACAAEALPRAEVAHRLRRGRFETAGVLADRPVVNVRWGGGVGDAVRAAAEDRYRLMEPVHREETTWRYVLHDTSRTNVLALLADPAVEDTSGLDRSSGLVLADLAEVPVGRGAEIERLVGSAVCPQPGQIRVGTLDRPDGLVSLDVEAPGSGFVLLSEPFYPERAAFVDGEPVQALEANLAFTAVPVPAGRHRVELRYVPAGFRTGLLVSLATVVAWAGSLWLQRLR